MFKLIAHRGNLNGSNKERENSPSYIQEALDKGYYVELDLRIINNEFWLGHDCPRYKVSIDFLKHPKLYIHSKTIETLYFLIQNYPEIHTFFHDKDDATLTSQGEIWTFPGKPLTPKSICVNLGKIKFLPNCLGLCSDYIE